MRATILYIVDPDTYEVLMAKKVRGVGAGFWFGYGGKFEDEDDNNPFNCVIREFEKETGGVSLKEYRDKLELVVRIRFFRGEDKNPLTDEPSFEVDCFRLLAKKSDFSNIKDTDEMQDATWFSVDNIPFDTDKMKPGDQLFVPKVINREYSIGYIWFEKENNHLLGSEILPCTKESLVV